MSVSVGDKVQIKNGGIDVTNGVRAKAGKLYGEGGPLWATVEKVVDGWSTGGRWGLPNKVTKVRCSNNGVVVWQVRPEDIHTQVVKKEEPMPKPRPEPKKPAPPPAKREALAVTKDKGVSFRGVNISASNRPFANLKRSGKWHTGVPSRLRNSYADTSVEDINTQHISSSMFDGNAGLQTPSYRKINIIKEGNKSTTPKSVKLDKDIYRAEYKNSWEDSGRRNEMLNRDTSLIQNDYNFPFYVGTVSDIFADKYDYQFIPGDERLSSSSPVARLQDRLKELRASLGIHVHGNNDIARSVKFYMYNRFKVPDTNLAHNKTFTHVFFTRPDLNLLTNGNTANSQTLNHTDTAMLWRRNPEIFKLLTDYTRCGDSNNFNMLLSNQIASISLSDETLSTTRAGKSWSDHEMSYAEQYTGRGAGEITLSFNETSEYSIINLIKLWMTYIDNVSRGAWSPLYNLSPENHVFSRALDYAASIYVFKCGPDGEDVLYWTKYYGVYPISSGASALGWDLGTPIGDVPKLNITFAYSYKRDMSPISLLEFNHVANVDDDVVWVPGYHRHLSHTARPFVGAPYIELDLGSPVMGMMTSNDVNRSTKRTQIRLKFRKDNKTSRRDSILYKA